MIFHVYRNILFNDLEGGMQVAREKRKLEIHCSFAEDGDELMEILRECFRAFLYRETQKSAHF